MIRTCIGCRARLPREQLLRIAVDEGGRARPDPAGLGEGRGAYVCPTTACVSRAIGPGGLSKSFRGKCRSVDSAAVFLQRCRMAVAELRQSLLRQYAEDGRAHVVRVSCGQARRLVDPSAVHRLEQVGRMASGLSGAAYGMDRKPKQEVTRI